MNAFVGILLDFVEVYRIASEIFLIFFPYCDGFVNKFIINTCEMVEKETHSLASHEWKKTKD